MHKSATLIILVLVGALYGLSQWNEQKKTDDQEQIKVLGQSQALLAGIGQDDFTRLAGLRIDNLRNGTQVTMERDGAGTWFLTDPVAWPAEPSILNLLFTTLQRSRGVEVLDVTWNSDGISHGSLAKLLNLSLVRTSRRQDKDPRMPHVEIQTQMSGKNRWLGHQGSNLGSPDQNRMPYRLAMPQP